MKTELIISLVILLTGLHASELHNQTISLSQKSICSCEKPNVQLEQMYKADQEARNIPGVIDDQTWDIIEKGDLQRRQQVTAMIKNNELRAPIDFYHAAMIFQHGDKQDDFWQAHILAKESVKRGYEQAKWLTAATYDRWLMSQKKPQKYGTQYTWNGQSYQLYEYDPQTTDQERIDMNVPVLKEQLEWAKKIPQQHA